MADPYGTCHYCGLFTDLTDHRCSKAPRTPPPPSTYPPMMYPGEPSYSAAPVGYPGTPTGYPGVPGFFTGPPIYPGVPMGGGYYEAPRVVLGPVPSPYPPTTLGAPSVSPPMATPPAPLIDPISLTDNNIAKTLEAQLKLGSTEQAPNLQSYRDEQTLRRQTVEAGTSRWEFKHPLIPPTCADVEVARRVWKIATDQGLVSPRSAVMSVGSLATGRCVVGFSGLETGKKLKALCASLDRYREPFGFDFADAPEAVGLYLLQMFLGSKVEANVCGEVKVVCELWGKSEGFLGITTLWIGTGPNPHPLLPGRTEQGSPMQPCGRCRDHIPIFYQKNRKRFPKPSRQKTKKKSIETKSPV